MTMNIAIARKWIKRIVSGGDLTKQRECTQHRAAYVFFIFYIIFWIIRYCCIAFRLRSIGNPLFVLFIQKKTISFVNPLMLTLLVFKMIFLSFCGTFFCFCSILNYIFVDVFRKKKKFKLNIRNTTLLSFYFEQTKW